MTPYEWHLADIAFRVLLTLLQAAVLFMGKVLLNLIKEIRQDIKENMTKTADLDKRVGQLETWKDGRDRHWAEHEIRHTQERGEVWGAIDDIRNRCLEHLSHRKPGE